MKRRHFLLCTAACVISAASAGVIAAAAEPAAVIPLWQGEPPGGGGPKGPVKISRSGAETNISRPSLSVFTPEKPDGYAVLIAAGGGYKRIEMAKEALPAAAWLTKHGFTAYVLSYRLPGEGWNDGSRVALEDAQRALRIIAQREKHVSVLGFSAGGHLLGMAVNRPEYRSYPPVDSLDRLPARAERAALIYPVITLEKPYSHTSTHKILAGRDADAQQNAQWSVQNYVTPQSPPFFLVQAKDDPISDPENTLIMQAACQREHVSVELFRYATGGHGFGMGRPGTPTMEWPVHYLSWLQQWKAGT